MSKRRVGIDYLRGVCILIVVFVHTVTFIGTPLRLTMFMEGIFLNGFYIISGYIYGLKKHETSTGQQIKRKIIHLGGLYIVLSILGIVLQMILSFLDKYNYISVNYSGWGLLGKNLMKVLTLNGVGPLWFLPVLCIANIFIIIIQKTGDKCKYAIMCVSIVLGIVAHEVIQTYMITVKGNLASQLILLIDRIIMGIIFVCIGYIIGQLLKKYDCSIAQLLISIVLMAMIMAVGLWFKLPAHYIFSTLLVLFVAVLIDKLNINKIIRTIFKPLSYMGEHSMYIMFVHYFIWAPIGFNLIKKKWENVSFLTNAELFIFVVGLTIITTFIIRKSKCIRRLFGEDKYFERISERNK